MRRPLPVGRKTPQDLICEFFPPVGHPWRIQSTISVSGSPASWRIASHKLLWNHERFLPTSGSGKAEPNSEASEVLAFKMVSSENLLQPGLPMDSATDVASSRSHNSSWSSLLKVSRIRRPVVLKLAQSAPALFGFRKPPTQCVFCDSRASFDDGRRTPRRRGRPEESISTTVGSS